MRPTIVWWMLVMVLFARVELPAAQEIMLLSPIDSWQVSTPEAQGMDSRVLLRLLRAQIETRTIFVIRHGRLVLDVSRYPYDSHDSQLVFEVAESVLSTLVGIAIDAGYIESVDQSIWDFFAADQTANMDDRKQAITIRHLLTHTSGVGFYDDVFDVSVDESWVQYWLDKPMQSAPGERYAYVGANSYLASALLGLATGKNAATYGDQVLFAPLGIETMRWVTDRQGVTIGNYYLFMNPADMAKLGYLFLRQGVWDGQQIVSREWINTATRHSILITDTRYTWGGYGYFWYSNELIPGERSTGYAACGYRGQVIRVVPELDLVVVIINDTGSQQQTIVNMVMDAVVSEHPVPENPAAFAELQAAVNRFAVPPNRTINHTLESG